MRLAVILVHYHTPELAAAAVAALQRDAAGLDVEWLLVDNGSDPQGRALLESLPVRRLDPGENRGYAGGVNLGVSRSSAELIVVMNPDVQVLPGCLPALVEALERGAAVAGPQLFWDSARRLLLPPAEPRTRRDELLALLARRGPAWAALARRRWRRHARRHWQAGRPLPSHALSGSLLALRRSAWEEVGPFDEGFRLYFEETEWLARVRRRGLAAWYVPAAQAVHLVDQSAAREPRSRRWFEESARRFRERCYGAWFADLLEGLDRRWPAGPAPALPEVPAAGLDLAGFRFPLWVEVSPNPEGFPAAAELLRAAPEERWRLAPEIAARLPARELVVQVADAAGRELERRVLRLPRGESSR
jgi:GT2 family glycosyltransferase